MSDDLLRVEDLAVSFGALAVIEDLSVAVPTGAIKGIIGPNGAGKTTLLNVITGSVKPKAGRVVFGERKVELTKLPPYARARLGIGRTFQHSNLFTGLSVLDQLLCGGYQSSKRSIFGTALRTPWFLKGERELLSRAYGVMDRLGLTQFAHLQPDRLPGATHRLVDLGRALMMQPRLLLLDEIAAGTTLEERDRVIGVVRDCRAAGMSVLVIEHDLQFIRELADDVIVLAEGHIIAAGETNDVLARPEVLAAYVGGAER